MTLLNEFICRCCMQHKAIRNESVEHKKTCQACDDKIARRREGRYKPSAKKVYTEAKINFLAKRVIELN